jgi:hypothetical protein
MKAAWYEHKNNQVRYLGSFNFSLFVSMRVNVALNVLLLSLSLECCLLCCVVGVVVVVVWKHENGTFSCVSAVIRNSILRPEVVSFRGQKR